MPPAPGPVIQPLPSRLLARERVPLLRALERRLGYRFKNLCWLEQAVAHSSFVNEHADSEWRDNEKLEFLGDAVLELTISVLLYRRYPEYLEGDLTKLRAAVVSRPTLGKIAQSVQIGDCLLLGRGEDRAGGRERPSLLADALEAVVGAVYLDSPRWWSRGYRLRGAARLVDRLFSADIARLDQIQHKMDFKSMLQEHAQSQYRTLPKYRVLGEEGPPHERTYEVEIRIDEIVYGSGRGRSKKQAEQEAARTALERMGALPPSEASAVIGRGGSEAAQGHPARVREDGVDLA